MTQSDLDLSTKPQALPPLSREALHRIEQAEKDAKERYDRDKMPYFPTSPDFSFFEGDILRSRARILEYARIYAEEVLDAHLREYFEVEPSALLTNQTLRKSLAMNVWTMTEQLWVGFAAVLSGEPTSRAARSRMAIALGTIDQHPELEPWRYPAVEQWADSWRRLTEPGSEMEGLNTRFTRTIGTAVGDLIQGYQEKAASKLGVKLAQVIRPEENPNGQTPSDTVTDEVQEPIPEAAEVAAGQSVTQPNSAIPEPSATPAIDKTEVARRRGRRPNQERRDAIRNAITKHGEQWRDHLSETFEELDGKEVFLGDFIGMAIDLGEGKTEKVSKWETLDLAQGQQRRQIVDALRKYLD